MKRRIEWSALLLFVLGLVSMATPHRMVHATVHHQNTSSGAGGTRTSRTSRQSGRSARGGLRTEMDTHEADQDRASQGVRPREVQLVAVAVEAIVTPGYLLAPSLARSELAPAVDDADVVQYEALPSRGRAPPTL